MANRNRSIDAINTYNALDQNRVQRITGSADEGIDGIVLLGTYRAHIVERHQYINTQQRSQPDWQEMFYGEQRELLAPQSVQVYRAQSNIVLSRPAPLQYVFAGYQTSEAVMSLIGGSTLGVLGQ